MILQFLDALLFGIDTYHAALVDSEPSGQCCTKGAQAQDDEGNTTNAVAGALVSITDATPTIQISKSAIPGSVPEPGDTVAFLITVLNTSPEVVTLTQLTDDIHGDLNGQGSCILPQVIDPGAEFDCIFSELISGNAGESETDTVTAEAQDDEEPVPDVWHAAFEAGDETIRREIARRAGALRLMNREST